MSNRNPTGTNQWGLKNYPPDDELRAAFQQFGKENNGSGLTYEEQIHRLSIMFNLNIKKTSLVKTRIRLGVQTVRSMKKRTSVQDRSQAVLDIKQNDLLGKWGVAQVRQRLANEGMLIARDETRLILHDFFDAEFSARSATTGRMIQRTPLDCIGPGHQVHCDGHEKLSAAALQMGSVSLSIYAYKDQFSSNCLHMRVLPNVRRSLIIGHAFLDWVEASGYIAIQMFTDKGSEIGEMIRIHRELRLDAAPEFTLEQWPSSLQVQSKHNTPIEGFWRWLRQGEGLNLRDVILTGRDTGLFNPEDLLHVDLFNWLFPPLVQQRLDIFSEYWNNHRISRQKKKILPSGCSPMQALIAPSSVRASAKECWIRVRSSKVAELRDEIGGIEARNDLLRWVDPYFNTLANTAHSDIGAPAITLKNVWEIFETLAQELDPLRPDLYSID